MERTPVPPLDVDFVTYREDLKLPSLEDFRVFWHAQMLAAQRYMTVVNEKYSLALHLSQDLQSKTLETNIRREFSSPKPRIVGSSKSPHLSWSDLIKETTDSSFTQENEDLFSCLVRGQKVELSAADCKRVNACRTLSILPPSPQNDINTERETISEVRKFISQCQKDREDAAKFEEQLDDLLRERDFQLREHQEAWKRSQKRILPSDPATVSPGSYTSLQSRRSRESSSVRDVAVPRWSTRKSPSPPNSVLINDPEETHRFAGSIPQQSMEVSPVQTLQSLQTPARLLIHPDGPYSPPIGTQPLGPETQVSAGRRPYVQSNEEEKVHGPRYILFLRDRGLKFLDQTIRYNHRFKTQRSIQYVTMKYHKAKHTKDEGVWQGFFVLQLNSKPRLKVLVDELFPE